jgi:tyrosine-protein kinase Etk/Wzc
MFNGARGPGLSDYFIDGIEFDQIIHRDRSSGVDYVPVGTARSKEAWLFTPDRLRPLIDRLGEQYAFVILDSAPVLAVPETVVLSQMAHKTIFVVRWGRTPARIAGHAVTQLLEAGAETAAVLSMVDMKGAAKYGDPVARMSKRLGRYYNS